MSPITRTAASIIGIVAAFALVLYLAYGGSGGGTDATPTPSAIAAASPTRTPTPTAPPRTPAPRNLPPVLEGTDVEYLENRSLVDFPEDTALIMETGCWQCGGASTGLRRMYKDPVGELRIEQLLSIEQLGIASEPDVAPYFTGYAIAPDASYMLAAVCIRGACSHSFDSLSPTSDARTAIFESTDGGVTWDLLEEIDLALGVEGLLSPRIALVSWQEEPAGAVFYASYPGFEPVNPPDDFYTPAFAIDGEVIWRAHLGSGLLVRGDRSVFLNFGEPVAVVRDLGMASYTSPDAALVLWSHPHVRTSNISSPRYFISLVNASGEVESSYEIHGPDTFLLSALWYGERTLIGTMANPPLIGAPDNYLGLLPAVLDLDTFYSNIEEPFLRDGYDPQRDIIHAVQTGPFARVVNSAGSCVNVRAPAGLDSMTFACVAEGVLLHDTHEHRYVDGLDWTRVIMPDGVEGWVASDYLESDVVVQHTDR